LKKDHERTWTVSASQKKSPLERWIC